MTSHHILKAAPPRAVSPTRSSTSSRAAVTKMPSPRSSPAIRPTSPLSPRFESANRFESLQPPSPRSMHRSAGNSQRRANTNSLKLPSLPRFHPANFPSTHSSAQNTPDSPGMGSPHPPLSPRTHQRAVSDAQKHLMMYQREAVSAARGASPAPHENPTSPRLVPLGSPGPVTPLELEGEEGYLVAGARTSASKDGLASEELVERLIKEEAARQRRTASNSPSRPNAR
jgi:hypothetical protein